MEQIAYIHSSLGRISPILEDVVALTCLPIFWEAKPIKLPEEPEEITLDRIKKTKLEGLNKALSDSKSFQ